MFANFFSHALSAPGRLVFGSVEGGGPNAVAQRPRFFFDVAQTAVVGLQEAKSRPNIPLQEKFHRGILRGLRNISEPP